MRKFLLFIMVAFAGATANAQVSLMKESVKKANMATPKAQSVIPVRRLMDSNWKSAILSSQAISKAEAEEEKDSVSAMYKLPDNALYAGLEDDGYYRAMVAYTPAFTEQLFRNYSYWNKNKEVTFDWQMIDPEKGTVLSTFEQDEDGNMFDSGWGAYYIPTLTVTQGEATDSYASTGNYYAYGYWYAGCDTITSLSPATASLGVYSGFTDWQSFDTNTPWLDSPEKKIVGFAQAFPAVNEVVYMEALHIGGWFDTNLKSPLDGGSLTATVYALNEDGSLGDQIATATATDETTVYYASAGYARIRFPFTEEDELFGEIEAPLILDGTKGFFVTITGFENITNTMSGAFSDADGWPGDGYVILDDGSLATVFYQNADVPQINMHIGFDGVIPALTDFDNYEDYYVDDSNIPVFEIPAEGGWAVTATEGESKYNNFGLYSSSAPEFYEVTLADEENDWLQVDSDDSKWETNNVVNFYFGAEALPEGVEGRMETVTISVYGKEKKAIIKQGEVTAIKGVTVNDENSKFAGATYNLAGQKVGADYKGIVIENGKKVVKK